MYTAARRLPQDRTRTPGCGVRASASQTDAHSFPGPASWLNPNYPVGSAHTFGKRSLESCASGPDGTQFFSPPTEPDPLVFQQFYQSSPPASTQQQLTRLQWLPERSQRQEDRLQLQVIHQDQWLQQFKKQQQQQQFAYPQQQQRQFGTSQNTSPFQELPMNIGPEASTTQQPWASELPYPLASQIPLYQPTHKERQKVSVPSTSDLESSSLLGHLPFTIQPESDLGQSWRLHVPLASQGLVPATTDCNRMEKERQDRVVACSKTEGRRPQKRLTCEQSRDIVSRREGEAPESFQTIAKAMGCSKSTAWRHNRKHRAQTKPRRKEDS
ncbi:MAG: hypothetical protein J3Q66DRAFT_367506 [Benniella sp.]|nr:MAG: hypothetical protein J3Q66DRAFT_367506 [Benniella sp.]